MKELTGQLQKQGIQFQRQTQRLMELQKIIAAKDTQIAALTARIEARTILLNNDARKYDYYIR